MAWCGLDWWFCLRWQVHCFYCSYLLITSYPVVHWESHLSGTTIALRLQEPSQNDRHLLRLGLIVLAAVAHHLGDAVVSRFSRAWIVL